MSEEHGITLLESDMIEIVNIVNDMKESEAIIKNMCSDEPPPPFECEGNKP